jgi:hypothetical protein
MHPKAAAGSSPLRALEANTKKPARSAKVELPEFPCGRRAHAQQKVRRRSGIGPERALEANTKKNPARSAMV